MQKETIAEILKYRVGSLYFAETFYYFEYKLFFYLYFTILNRQTLICLLS